MKTSAQQLGKAEKLTQLDQDISRNAGSFGSGLGVLVLGFPGAGKTTVAAKIQETLAEEVGEPPPVLRADLKDLTDVVGRHETAEYLDVLAEAWPFDERELAVIDSVRTFDEIRQLSKFFDSIVLVFVDCHHAARHTRLIDDARARGDDLDNYSHDELRHRDMEAGAAGLDAIENEQFCDLEISNEGIDVDELKNYAQYAARDLYLDYKYDNL